MNVQNIEKKEKDMATFEVKVDAAVFDAEVEKAYRKNKSQLSIPGFRKGKAPRQVIEGMYGKEIFYEEAIEGYMDTAFDYGKDECGLEIVGSPGIADVKVTDEGELVYTFEVATYPEVGLGQYRGLAVKQDHAEFSEKLVEDELADVRKRNARLLDVDRPVQSGDRVVLDFDGFVNGKPFEGGSAQDYDLEIGSNTFIPGFEDQVIGAAIGEEREISVTFPEQYAEELAGKDAVFKIKIKSVREPELPELDDELAKDISDFDTIAEYIDHVREDQKAKFEKEQESAYAGKLMQAALDNLTVTIPEPMIAEKVDQSLRSYAMSIGMNGNVSKEEIFKAMNIDAPTYYKIMKPQAEYEIKTDMLLDAIVKAEGIELAEDDIAQAYQEMSDEYGMEVEEIKKYVDESILHTDLKRRKAAAVIRNTAVDREPEPKEEEKTGEAPAEEKPAE